MTVDPHGDAKLIKAAICIGNDAKEEIDAELRAITGGAVETAGQVDRLLEWLAANGCELPNLKKPTLRQALQRTELPKTVGRAIKLRLRGAHAATAKYERLRDWTSADGRIRGAFTYHGAATGRWTSFGVQLQNLKRPAIPDLVSAIEAVRTSSYAYLRTKYEDPLSVVGDVVRAAICAAPGHRLIDGDLSGVESRVTAWLAGEQAKLDLWRKYDETQSSEDEPYYHLGCRFGFPVEVARASGKVADLAFGFMGGEGAYRKLAPEGDTSTKDDINRQRRAWRDAHPAVVKLWEALSVQAVRAVANRGKVCRVNDMLSFEYDGIFLRMHLPSGRAITYPFPRLKDDKYGKAVVVFKDNSGGKFVDCRNGDGAWAGTWIENAVQGVARDLLAAALLRLEAAGYSVVLHVHDEIVAEVPEGLGGEAEFLQIMTSPPEWANGLPIAAKVRSGPRFCKTDKSPKAAEEACAEEECEANAAFDEVSWSDRPKSRRAENGSGNRESEQWRHDGYASGEREWGSNVDEYIYRDQTGARYLKVVRTSKKQFPQFHWQDGKWVKGKPKDPKIPFMLPELLAAPPEEPVWIVEGEKDATNLAKLELVATTNSEGAHKWTPDLGHWFVGKKIVYILEDNDTDGRQHAGEVAMLLKDLVAEIRIVSFPELPEKGDVSDWLGSGHSREELLQRAQAAPKFDPGLGEWDAGEDDAAISPRGWLLANIFCREFASSLLGDGGVGKTAVRVAQLMSLACGRPLTGEHVFARSRVLIVCLEDSTDELRRRVKAARIHHKVTREELKGWLFLACPGSDAGKLMFMDDHGRLALGALAAKLEEVVLRRKIDLISLDPFVKTHAVGENTNDAIDKVIEVLTDLAHKYNIAIDAPHHVSKGQAEPGNAQKGRGASAFVDAGRLVYTLSPMSAEEAKAFGISEAERRYYVRMDKAKVNITPPAAYAKWFKLVGVPLGNATELYPHGDNVQTVEPWTPPDTWADLDSDLQNRILDEIDAGLPAGARYSDASAARDRAAWRVVKKYAPEKTEPQAREIIKAWVKSDVLENREYNDPGRREEVVGLFVNPDKRPA